MVSFNVTIENRYQRDKWLLISNLGRGISQTGIADIVFTWVNTF